MYAVPNDASAPLLNAPVVPGRVVLADRGVVPLVDKARYVQRAGGAALILVDASGDCDESFNCGGTLGSKAPGVGLAAQDDWQEWVDVAIPVLMVTKRGGDRLRRVMNLTAIETEEHGLQMFNAEIVR